jgi:DNA polymerase III subunit epsilon
MEGQVRMKLPVLPVYYYLDHFTEMLDFVGKTYGSILTDEHHSFVTLFQRLSKGAQCLLIRMINRRGAIFNRVAFKYAEIADLRGALADLMECGQARYIEGDDYAAFVACLPKDTLFKGAKAAGFNDVRSSWSKPKLVAYFLASIPFPTAFEFCEGERFVALANTQPVEFLLYLYFGKTEDNLKNFALRDLGIMRTNKGSTFSARFSDGEEARACFHYSRLIDRLELKSPEPYQRAINEILGGPPCPTEFAADIRSRCACQTGQYFEKLGDRDLALQLYRAGSSPECHERLVRLLYICCDKAGAEELLKKMIDDPASDGEMIFATDFYARKFNGRRTGMHTELLRSGVTITVDDTYRGNPEAGVAGAMRRKGYQVFFAENTLWQSLFGLLFWDELFESGQLHSGFDWGPHCLKDRSFARQFAAQIEAKLEALRAGTALGILVKTVAAKWGRPNGVFAWDYVNIDAIRLLLTGASQEGIACIVKAMSENYRDMRDGFPDLMLVKDGEVSLMEIKAEGDVIRRNQLTRLHQLRNAGIKAEIGRVDFRFDPEQDYVVVDIETTGGWASGDRITEIGAVRIRNHQVIEEWHSLINPQRSIPPRIVQLTGITNDMVRNAPLFGEIADSFMQFMGDAIFVAHNVNFDYGFIASEYERLERRFRFPKLCTVAGMRRRYPGNKSYSLGNLCAVFDIELEDHHRALCDARAAAHLLNLINRKRDGLVPESVQGRAA